MCGYLATVHVIVVVIHWWATYGEQTAHPSHLSGLSVHSESDWEVYIFLQLDGGWPMLLGSTEEMVLLVLMLGDTIRAMSMDCPEMCLHFWISSDICLLLCLGACPHTCLQSTSYGVAPYIMFKNLS